MRNGGLDPLPHGRGRAEGLWPEVRVRVLLFERRRHLLLTVPHPALRAVLSRQGEDREAGRFAGRGRGSGTKHRTVPECFT